MRDACRNARHPRRTLRISSAHAAAIALTVVLGLFAAPLGSVAALAQGMSLAPISALPAPPLVHPAVCGPLMLNATASPSTGPAPLNVTFTAVVSGGCPPYRVHWELGDEYETSGLRVTHIFPGAGRYPVEVHASDVNGTNTSTELTVVVTSGGGTVSVHVGASPSQGTAPLLVRFWGNLSGGNLSGAIDTEWAFGDGGTGRGSVVTHSFSAAGSYVATATVRVNGTTVGSGQTSIQTFPGGSPQHANLSVQASPGQGDVPLNVSVTAYSNGAQGPAGLSICFGDAPGCTTVSTSWSGVVPFIVAHNYSQPGNYSLSATLLAPNGTVLAGASASVVVLPYTPIGVAVDATPTSGTPPLAVTFDATITGGTAPYLIQWVFGDGSVGSTISGQAVTHSYADLGTFTPKLTVIDVSGHNVTKAATPIQVVAPQSVAGLPSHTGGLPTIDLVVLGVSGSLIVAFVLGPYLARGRHQAQLRLQGEALARRMEQQK